MFIRNPKVLLVGSHEERLDKLKKYMEREGIDCRVITTTDEGEAIFHAQEEVHLIIVDDTLGRVYGRSLIKTLRSIFGNNRMPRIALHTNDQSLRPQDCPDAHEIIYECPFMAGLTSFIGMFQGQHFLQTSYLHQ